MDPKRKRLYIILIIGCLILSAGILMWNRLSNNSIVLEPATTLSVNPASVNPAVPAAATAVKKDSSGNYSAPVVFPANKTLDASVLDFSAFKILSSYQPAQVSPSELGREDPFKNY